MGLSDHMVQRWREGRDSYRPAREVVDTRGLEVEPVGASEAKEFVKAHHYSGSYPADRRRFGLYAKGGGLVGVAVFSVPMQQNLFRDWFSAPASECVELGRFVLLDEVGANAETWFLSRCFKALKREGFAGILSFSDPVPRMTERGRVAFSGHIGTIYQAHNAHYLGRGTATRLSLLPNGVVFSKRAASKIRQQEVGWQYAERILVDAGAPPRQHAEPPAEWLKEALSLVTRPLEHPGNHRYGWALQKRAWAAGVQRGEYPKALEKSR